MKEDGKESDVDRQFQIPECQGPSPTGYLRSNAGLHV